MHSYERHGWSDREGYKERDRDRGRDRGGEFNKPMRGRRGYGSSGYSSSHTRRGNDLSQGNKAPLLFYGQPPLKELEDWKTKGLRFSGPTRSSPLSNEEGGGEDLGEADKHETAASVPSIEEAYTVYREKYLSRVQEAFIKQHSGQEWFIERYHPMAIQYLVKESKSWAESRALLFVEQLTSNPSAFIESAHLDPIKRDWGVGDVEENNSSGSVTMPSVVDLERYGECCILLRKLPAWMTRKALEDAIITGVGSFQRLIISDAAKSKDQKFVRNGYALFATEEEAIAAARRINGMQISSPMDCIVPRGRGKDSSNPTHELSAFHFRPKGFEVISGAFSTPDRLQKDATQAETLAIALDEERRVPENCRLTRLLCNETAVCNELQKSNNPAAESTSSTEEEQKVIKAVAAATIVPGGDVEIVGSDDVGEMATAVNRRHVEDTAAGDTTVPDVYEDVSSDIALTTTEKDMKDEGDGSHHDKTSGVSLPPCDGLEQRDSSEVVIISEGQEVSGWENEEEFKVVGKKECKSSSGDETQLLAVDLAYTTRLEEAQPEACRNREAELENEVVKCSALESEAENQWMDTHIMILENGTARCGMEGCGKLFRNTVFLQKHLKNKHAEELAAVLEVASHPMICSAFELDPSKPIPTIPIYKEISKSTTDRDGLSHRSRVGDYNRGKTRDRDWEGNRDRERDRDWERGPSYPPHFHDGYMMAVMAPHMMPIGGLFPPVGIPHSSMYGGSILPPPALHHQDIEPTDPRQMVDYVDVDAPKVETPAVSYGESESFFPPPKKRKKSKMMAMELEGEERTDTGAATAVAVAVDVAAPNVTEIANDLNESDNPVAPEPSNVCATTTEDENREG